MGEKRLERKHAIFIGSLGGLIASFCCLGPVILIPLFILLGIGSISLATTLGEYKLHLIALGIFFMLVSLWIYLRKKEGICNKKVVWNNRYFIAITIATYIITLLVILYLILPIITPIIFENI